MITELYNKFKDYFIPVIIIIGTYLLLIKEYEIHPFKTTIFSSKYKTLDDVIFWRHLANITHIERRQSFYSYKTAISKKTTVPNDVSFYVQISSII